MKNCLILGFGRSGTSLLGGLLYHSGYFLGNHLHPPRATNPKGFYEDILINRINEQILAPYDYSKHNPEYPEFPKEFSPYHPRRGHRWLTWIEPGTRIVFQDENLKSQIRNAVSKKQPFAYKDPRFNYSLPVWNELIPENTCFLCVFRNPAAVVQSVIKECNAVEYLSNFYIDEDLCFQIWYNSYRHLLETMTLGIESKTLFVSYEELIQNKQLDKISRHLDAKIENDFIEPTLNRSGAHGSIPVHVNSVYNDLKALAGQE